jgi:hypothetical protein
MDRVVAATEADGVQLRNRLSQAFSDLGGTLVGAWRRGEWGIDPRHHTWVAGPGQCWLRGEHQRFRIRGRDSPEIRMLRTVVTYNDWSRRRGAYQVD